jgi:hypothetical protein
MTCFPGLNDCHLHLIAPVVQQACEKFGVNYKSYETWRELLGATDYGGVVRKTERGYIILLPTEYCYFSPFITITTEDRSLSSDILIDSSVIMTLHLLQLL